MPHNLSNILDVFFTYGAVPTLVLFIFLRRWIKRGGNQYAIYAPISWVYRIGISLAMAIWLIKDDAKMMSIYPKNIVLAGVKITPDLVIYSLLSVLAIVLVVQCIRKGWGHIPAVVYFIIANCIVISLLTFVIIYIDYLAVALTEPNAILVIAGIGFFALICLSGGGGTVDTGHSTDSIFEIPSSESKKECIRRVRDKETGKEYDVNEHGIIDIGSRYGISYSEWNDTYVRGSDGKLYEKR